MAERIRLGVNVDHVATVRQARRGREPDPVTAAALAEIGGADLITVHLREDRRHIQERDVRVLCDTVRTALNLEMAAAEDVIKVALDVRPQQATLVPERREEVTTEGGLDVAADLERLAAVVARLAGADIRVSMFIDPDEAQVEAARRAGAHAIELHTGAFAHASVEEPGAGAKREHDRLYRAARMAQNARLGVHAGHGLDYWNVSRLRDLPHLEELNIGHAIVARAILVGMTEAVREMRALLD